MNRVIISAPFGNYLTFTGMTPTLGTFTLNRRGGWLRRLWKIATTVRRREGGWVNRLGLPNPGIDSLLGKDCSQKIVSVHGFDRGDWYLLSDYCRSIKPLAVELNLSCPNVGVVSVEHAVFAAQEFMAMGFQPIAKLAPVEFVALADALFGVGVRRFHLCNSLPTKWGGLSGIPLRELSLHVVEGFRQRFGREIEIIGGGGVTCEADAIRFLDAGADRVAVGSMLFNPFNWFKVPGVVRAVERRLNCSNNLLS